MRRTILALPIMASAGAFAAPPPLPVPPIPPAEAPLRDAPVPDLNARQPFVDGKPPPVTLDMAIHRRPQSDLGLGDPDGTRYRSDIDHRVLAIPGFKLHFPFP
jgi:hypothetical protein